MLITEITVKNHMVIPGDPARFRVGEPLLEEGHVVEKITYNPQSRLFNKGNEIGRPGYTVFFNDVQARRFVAEEVVSTIEVIKSETPNIPELPE